MVGKQLVKSRSHYKILINFSFDTLNNWCICQVVCGSILGSPTSTKKRLQLVKKLNKNFL